MLKVAKFGGSSLADAAQFAKVRQIVQDDPSRRVVVVSAPGKRSREDHKVTDLLYLCHAHLQYGVDCSSVFQMIRDRFYEIRDDLGLETDLDTEFDRLKKTMTAKMPLDALVSRGEYLTAKLMADYLGFTFLDAASWLTFRLDGTVDEAVSYGALRELVRQKQVVIPGFYGAMPDGTVHIFSRGGSDITGALAAAALGAHAYENWTDVSGVLMADPRIVKDPRTIPGITYNELRELSYLGAQVLHADTVAPVRALNIPLNIRNTNRPLDPGTMIMEQFSGEWNPGPITGIAGRKGFTVFTLFKSGLSGQPGALLKVLEVFSKLGVGIEYMPNGVDNISLVVSETQLEGKLYTLVSQLQHEVQPDQLTVQEHVAILAAVGRQMVKTPGICGRICSALGQAEINIRLLVQGATELNIIVGIEESQFEAAIVALYETFLEGK